LLNVSKGKTVAYVKTKAISAGALIALACNSLIMKEGTTIGDCEPITYSQEGPKTLGEKIQSPLRAKFRTLAKRNGYPQALAEAMVSKDIVVYRVTMPDTVLYMDSLAFAEMPRAQSAKVISKRTVVARGKLLTMNDDEALQLGFSRASVGGIDEALKTIGISEYELVRIEENWSETFVRFLTKIAPLLMMIGLAALYMEIRTPGFGIPGIIGIICLSLVFFGQHAVGLADYTEMLLVIIGLLLLFVEVFVTPGFGFIGLAGILCIAIGMILTLQGFTVPKPEFPWQMELLMKNIIMVFSAGIGAFVLGMLVMRYAFPHVSKVISGPYLAANLQTSHADVDAMKDVNIGDEGVVKTALRPAGKARIGNSTLDVVAEGDFIEQGVNVRVIEASPNKIVVARINGNG
ncbi:MAG: serine protease, partial [Chitinivibrionales bacterium]|nr:serine protease [Chitinivibrionales bacterium]